MLKMVKFYLRFEPFFDTVPKSSLRAATIYNDVETCLVYDSLADCWNRKLTATTRLL